jgi:hypothetical protein
MKNSLKYIIYDYPFLKNYNLLLYFHVSGVFLKKLDFYPQNALMSKISNNNSQSNSDLTLNNNSLNSSLSNLSINS